MTRISSAQRNINAFLDQIVNARSDAAAAGASTEQGSASAFDSHFALFDSDANASSLKKGSNPNADAAAQEAASNQTKPGSAVSALFAALANSESLTNQQSASSDPTQTVTEGAKPSQTKPADAATALFSALAADDQGGGFTNSAAGVSADQSQAPLSTLLSLANTNLSQASANKNTAPASNAAADSQTQADTNQDILSLTPMRLTVQKSTASSTSNTKRSDTAVPPATKRTDQTSNASADLAASAQLTVAMVASSLSTPQSAPAPTSALAPALPTLRKDASSSTASGVNAAAQGKNSKASPLSGVQSASDTLQPVTPDTSVNPFADFAESSDDLGSATIKMPVSSIQAQTHFAPVQQLSPTQQIFDFVALTGGVSSLEASSAADTAAATTGASSTPDPGASMTASLAASPVKTLTLALEPDALGTVTIKMRLVNAGLEVQVEAEKPDTTSLIEKDKDNLSDKLQSLGYSVDSLVVKTVANQSANLDPSNDQSTAGQGQQAANDAAASGSSQNGGRNASDQSSAQSRGQSGGSFRQDSSGDLSPSIRPVGDGVYL